MLRTQNRENIDRDVVLIQKVLDGDSRAFEKLFNKYRPVANKIWGAYYMNDMDLDDWYQESQMVMFKIINDYDFKRGVGFGCYYRRSLRNRFFDLIRRKNAKKRVPDKVMTSFSANQEWFEDTIVDVKASSPEKTLFVNISFGDILKNCSQFEQRVLIGVLKGEHYSKIAQKECCSSKRVINAFERCKKKFGN